MDDVTVLDVPLDGTRVRVLKDDESKENVVSHDFFEKNL